MGAGMSGGSFDYAYMKTMDFNDAGHLLSTLYEMRDYCESIHPRAVVHIDLYIFFLEDMTRRYLEEGEKIKGLIHEIEWEASGDRGIEDVIEVLDCMGIPGLIA
jgi:hypothetical protein